MKFPFWSLFSFPCPSLSAVEILQIFSNRKCNMKFIWTVNHPRHCYKSKYILSNICNNLKFRKFLIWDLFVLFFWSDNSFCFICPKVSIPPGGLGHSSFVLLWDNFNLVEIIWSKRESPDCTLNPDQGTVSHQFVIQACPYWLQVYLVLYIYRRIGSSQ